MKINRARVLTAIAVAAGCTFGFGGDALAKAVPAGTASFGGTCTAKFVRSSSGIVNETERECTGQQNPWTTADVYLQFRPLTPDSKPNPACNPVGLVTSFGPWANYEASIAPWFHYGPEYTYNVCVYLVNPVVASGSIDAADMDGVMTAAAPLAGNFEVCVSGTWTNRNGIDLIDAEYVSQDLWATHYDGLPPTDPWAPVLGPNFADVQIDGQFLDWGAYSDSHDYCTTGALALGQSLNLAVFDGYGFTNTKEAGWYGDNSGSLAYTLRYLGQ